MICAILLEGTNGEAAQLSAASANTTLLYFKISLLITTFWISLVPSPMVHNLLSR